jgi:hypothetical protein
MQIFCPGLTRMELDASVSLPPSRERWEGVYDLLLEN